MIWLEGWVGWKDVVFFLCGFLCFFNSGRLVTRSLFFCGDCLRNL